MAKKKRWHCLPGQPLTEMDKQELIWSDLTVEYNLIN